MQTVIVTLIVAWAAWRVWRRYGPDLGTRFGPRPAGGATKAGGCAGCGGCGSDKGRASGCAPGERPVHFVAKPPP